MTEPKKKATTKKCVAKKVLFTEKGRILVGEEFVCSIADYDKFKKDGAV
jgi:hypothetical protein